jgi:hypothetical protein
MSQTMNVSTTRPRFSIEMLHKSDLVIASSLFFFTILFLYTLRPIEMSDNSLGYISVLQNTAEYLPFFYPPHLLHAPIISVFHLFLPPSCDIKCAGMLHSMIWAAITVVSTYIIARVVLASVLGSIATALTVLVSHGFWVFATQLEVYVPSVGCVTAATALLFTNQYRTLDRVRVIAVATLWALATMYHLANAFLFVPLCAFFYGAQGWAGWRQLAIVSALAGSVVLTTFVVVYDSVYEQWSVSAFLSWALHITEVPLTDWGSLSNWMRPSKLMSAGWSQIKTFTLLPEYLTLSQKPLWVIGTLAVAASLFWNLIQIVRSPQFPAARVYLLSLFVTNFAFFTWWSPNVHKFYIPSSIPLVVLTALAVTDVYGRARGMVARRLIAGGVAAVIAILFVFNLSSVLELRRSRGPYYAEAAILNGLAPENCAIYASGHHLNALAVYFRRQNRVPTHLLEREFYRVATGESPAERAIFEGEECALIALGSLSERWYESRMDGYLDTGTWPGYIGYFFDVRPSSEGGGITYDDFELVGEEDGPPYVLVRRGRRVHARNLDELTDLIRIEVDHAVQKYRPDYPTLEQGDLFLAEVPRADIEIGRVRGRIFGY